MPTVTRFPSTDTAVSGTWSNPTNVQADDGAVASVTLAVKNTTVERTQGGYGFDANIPAGASISSVTVAVEWRVSTTGAIASLAARHGVSGSYVTSGTDAAEPTTLTVRTYSAVARPGGGSWTRADLLDAVFTTRLQAIAGNNATSCTYEYDYIKVTVDYSTFQPAWAARATTLIGS